MTFVLNLLWGMVRLALIAALTFGFQSSLQVHSRELMQVLRIGFQALKAAIFGAFVRTEQPMQQAA